MAFLAAVFAFPALAAADPPEDGAVVESLAPSHQGPWAQHWSRQRLEAAKPLPTITLPDPGTPAGPEVPPEAASESTASGPWKAATTAALRAATASQTAGIEGVEISAAESNLFPNSANGKLFGTYEVRINAHEFKREDYVCSASVIKAPEVTPLKPGESPPQSNVVLTAGHCAIDPETGT